MKNPDIIVVDGVPRTDIGKEGSKDFSLTSRESALFYRRFKRVAGIAAGVSAFLGAAYWLGVYYGVFFVK